MTANDGTLLSNTANDSTHHARTHCDVYPEFDSVGLIMSPLTTISYLVIPILILSVCNAIILHHIKKLKQRFAKKIGESAMDSVYGWIAGWGYG